MKNRYKSRKSMNLLTIFLLLDLFIMAIFFKTSNATYTSEAVSTTEMDVALYAFNFSGISQVTDENDAFDSQNILDINLGDIAPGETKYYKFRVYNTDKDGNVADTNISYELKIITTTNIRLDYDLYFNQNPLSSNAVSLINSHQLDSQVMTDGYGTYFRVFTVPEKCFNYNGEKYDEYTLKVTFPKEYSTSDYQDLVESVKVQMISKQVLTEDNLDSICR